jgi:hypothetical protein
LDLPPREAGMTYVTYRSCSVRTAVYTQLESAICAGIVALFSDVLVTRMDAALFFTPFSPSSDMSSCPSQRSRYLLWETHLPSNSSSPRCLSRHLNRRYRLLIVYTIFPGASTCRPDDSARSRNDGEPRAAAPHRVSHTCPKGTHRVNHTPRIRWRDLGSYAAS